MRLRKIVIVVLTALLLMDMPMAQPEADNQKEYIEDGVLEDLLPEQVTVTYEKIPEEDLQQGTDNAVQAFSIEDVLEQSQQDITEKIESKIDDVLLKELENIDFSTKRLIVEADKDLIEPDEQIIFEYENIYIIEYTSIEDVKKAYINYKTKSINVEPDLEIEAAQQNTENINTQQGLPVNNNGEDSTQPTEDEKKDYTGTIALLDSGSDANNQNIIDSISMIDDNPNDENGHGSLMADFIVQENPSARIVSVKVLDENAKGSIAPIMAGIR